MNVSNRLLYWGLFLVALGSVLVAGLFVELDKQAISDVLRLWPVVVIAVGIAILVRRTRWGVAAWVVSATLLGLSIGGAVAAGPQIAIDCGGDGNGPLEPQSGTFDGPARVALSTACGSLSVSVADGSLWHVDTEDPSAATGTVTASRTSLSFNGGSRGWVSAQSRDTWTVTVPASTRTDLDLESRVGRSELNLVGAQLGDLQLASTLGETRVDLTEATLSTLEATAQLASIRITLPGGSDVTAVLKATAGQIQVCVPDDVGLRVSQGTPLGQVTYEGFEQRQSVWQTPGYDQAAHHVDLSASLTAASLELNPIGGCK